ncbi:MULTISPECIES: SDR family NAD(P)-dependent oxidoreductase [unclassified Saccharicrinis]|uniref:SDR family NAD(P)-dependent oxidoreductase n=1 Tax=unclassified Saccharicrinis TaxID=2646859 RepID=UPI003D3365F7
MDDYCNYAMVTGAGKGLGKSIARELAMNGYNLLLLAQKGEGLPLFCKELHQIFNVRAECLEIDFLWPDALSQIKAMLGKYEIKVLVNNAGVGGSMFFEQSNLAYIDTIVQVNVRMVAMITHLLIPKLKEHTESFILNVASMASCCPIAYKTVYPASKAFVYSFSKSLAHELRPHGVRVSVLLPGPIKTNSEVAQRIEKQGWWVKAGLQTPQQLAAIAIHKMLHHKKVIIPGWINKINWVLLKLVPQSLSIFMVSRAVKNEIDMVGQVA